MYVEVTKLSSLYDIELLCKVLRVSQSGYYESLKEKKESKYLNDQALLIYIKVALKEIGNRRSGFRMVHAVLQRKKIPCSKKRVRNLMRENNLSRSRKNKTRANVPDYELQEKQNLLNRQFNQPRPGLVFASDITYLTTNDKVFYLAAFIDLGTRKIVGFHMEDHMQTSLVKIALQKSLNHSQLQLDDLMVHTDRGSQYTSEDFRKMLEINQIKHSLSRVGNCWDNAVMESFWATLKDSLGDIRDKKEEELKRLVARNINEYNSIRPHSSLDYQTPIEKENNYFLLLKQDQTKTA